MSEKPAIYLDSNAGAPLHPRVLQALIPFFESNLKPFPANPSSIHSQGRKAKRLLAEAREQVAFSLGDQVDPEQVLFTSSGTEANQLAIRSVFEPLFNSVKSPHWITTPVEHDSVLQMVDWVKVRGGEVSFLPVDETGAPKMETLKSLWRPDQTRLVSCVWVNNETGVVSDVLSLAEFIRSQGGVFHLDAAQAWGKVPLDVRKVGADFIALSAHKIGGLSGTGALWVKPGRPVQPLLLGKQEKGRRGGTENLVGIIAMGAAASGIDALVWSDLLEPLRDRLENAICQRIPGTRINGKGARRVANTLNLSFDGVEGDGLVMALDLAGYSVSSGSACSSGALEPSHVLLALGRTRQQAMAALRISLHNRESWDALEKFVSTLTEIIMRMRTAATPS